NDLEANPAIQSVTASTSVPGGEVGGSAGIFMKDNANAVKRCRIFGIDKKFIPAYGLSILEGRNFSTDRPAVDSTDIQSVILNETATKVFGYNKPSDIVGKEMDWGGTTCKIVGVVKDYHQESLQYSFDPTVFYPEEERNFGNFSIKINTADLPALMSFVKQKWNTHFPESPYRFGFLDERFNSQYNSDKLFSTVLWLFTIVAVIIACLGLFGLSLYTIAKRNKEISVRKVLGATIPQIIGLITKDYLKLVVVAGIVALPVAFILVNNWLKKYAFHIDIGLWFFILPIVMIVTIALITVLYQSLKAAITNPVKSLRTE
ncbi:MAG: FtsX-like permease family protein, partial [Chitinophagaceae bacterium]